MQSRKVVDLRSRKPGANMHPFPFMDPGPRRKGGRSTQYGTERLRVRRKRLRIIGALSVFTLIVVGVYAASWVSYLPQFSVSKVNVTGEKAVSQRLIRAYIDTKLYNGKHSLLSRSNIFLYPKSSIENDLIEYFPRIKSAKVSRSSLLATAINVSIDERDTFAKWCDKEGCYFLGESGFIFAIATSSAQAISPYIFRGGLPGLSGTASTTAVIGQRYLPGNFEGVLALLERLGQAGFSAREVVAKDDRDFSVRLQQGFEVRVSYGADVGALVKNLELILASEPLRGKEDRLEYIDLRFGNRVYFKLKGEEQQGIQ